ncbi:MAG: alpha/beta hydrolase [Polyangiales bacterium]
MPRLSILCIGLSVGCTQQVAHTHPEPQSDPPKPRPSLAAAPSATPIPVVDAASDVVDAGPVHLEKSWGIAFVAGKLPIVYLHGMWASPEDSCSYFERAATKLGGLLICPRGNRPAAQGGAWGGTLAEKRRSLDAAIAELGTETDTEGTLLGFSSGAAFAVDLAIAEPGKWTGLVLMSMKMDPRAKQLKAAGVRRVVFAAGELDASYPSMVAATKSANAAGLEAKFLTLGKVGHHFAVDMEDRMAEAIAWVRAI